MPLTPDKKITINGLVVNQYFLTESKNNPNKIDMPAGNRKKTVAITVHNTEAINTASNTTAAEQYTRATKNGAMKSVRVHYYVDDYCAWQNMPDDWVNWSCADGTANANSGNNTSVAIEVIGNSGKAEANAIKLVAYLLKKYSLTVDSGLRTHTYWLNVRDGKTGSIDYLNTVHNSYKMCLPLDSTELLTPNGWKKLADITIEDEVAQYSNGIITFVHPEAIVEPYVAKTLKTRYLEATPNHRMLVKGFSSKNEEYSDKLWGDILSKTTPYKMNTSGLLSGELDISDDELLLIAWIQGDGHYMKDKNNDVIGLEFHLKKERKIKRICQLLDELQIEYRQSWCKDGSVHIRIYDKKIYEWAEQWLENKEFSYKLLSMSQEQFNLFVEELTIIDGHKNNRQEIYTSSSIKNLDFIQALCATHNKRSSQCTLGTSKKFYGEQPTCVNFLKTNASFCRNDNIVERETMVSCVSVPSSYILIRQNNHTFIVGNCPIYILPHWPTFKENVRAEFNKISGVIAEPEKPTQTTPTTLYRIRKTWNDVKSQIGAFSTLENAKKAWKEGYIIFDSNGKQVYPDGAELSTSAAEPKNSTVDKINVKYRVYAKKKWWPEVSNTTDYAGVKGYQITAVAAQVDKGTISYRVHQKGSNWMSWISGYNINDIIKGYAGIPGIAIDAIQIKFSGIDGFEAKYRVAAPGKDYYNWVYNDSDYAGVFGQVFDRLQIEIVKK